MRPPSAAPVWLKWADCQSDLLGCSEGIVQEKEKDLTDLTGAAVNQGVCVDKGVSLLGFRGDLSGLQNTLRVTDPVCWIGKD